MRLLGFASSRARSLGACLDVRRRQLNTQNADAASDPTRKKSSPALLSTFCASHPAYPFVCTPFALADMGATKPASKGKGSKGKSGGSSGKSSKSKSKSKPTGSAPEGISKRKQKSLSLAKPGGAQKTKSIVSKDGKKKKRVYSEKELDIPALNGIVPAGIAKPKGVKKGKKFVDDPVSMV